MSPPPIRGPFFAIEGDNEAMMRPALRKLLLSTHLVVSLGWFGAAGCVLALGGAGLAATTGAAAVYEATAIVWRTVIIPFSVAALVTGVVPALGTHWGLFRHYWVLTKLVITVALVLLLLLLVADGATDTTPLAPRECLVDEASPDVLAQSMGGFGPVQGRCGWSYRYAPTNDLTASQEMTRFADGAWHATEEPTPLIVQGGAHPSAELSAIRRWTSNYSGVVRLTGIVGGENGDVADGVQLRIFVGAKQINLAHDVPAGTMAKPLSEKFEVAIGENIDFVIDPKGNTAHDSTTFAVEIRAE